MLTQLVMETDKMCGGSSLICVNTEVERKHAINTVILIINTPRKFSKHMPTVSSKVEKLCYLLFL